MIEIPDQTAYTNGAWFGIGAFTASAAIAAYAEMYTAAGACALLAGLWYIGLRQAAPYMNKP